jgi:hypothetical protein
MASHSHGTGGDAGDTSSIGRDTSGPSSHDVEPHGWVRDTLLATAASLMIARDCGRPEQVVLLTAASRDLALVRDQLGPPGAPRAKPA